MNTSNKQPELTPIVFHILLALHEKERHGYEIIKSIEEDTDGSVKLLTGTLYLALKRLVDSGLIVESERRPDPAHDDQRRRYYRLTNLGIKALMQEMESYRQLLELANRKFLKEQGYV